jgi:hypothetical protein
MTNLEAHVSPDGLLRFLVVVYPDGDIALGFDGFPWHTHADILTSLLGLEPGEAIRRYVDDLLNDKSVIAVCGVPGEVRDVWITEEPARDATYPIEGEVIDLRYWSGRAWVNN